MKMTSRATPSTSCAIQGAVNYLLKDNRFEIIQRVLGQKDIRSTLGYAELSEAQVRTGLEYPQS